MSFTSWLSSWKQPRRCPIASSAGARRKKAHYCRPGLECLEARLAPATYLVNVLTDTAPGSGGAGSGTTGDLRYCITKADSAGGTDTISLAPGLSGTITVQSQALPAISASITLNGPGASAVTVNGNSLGSVFSIDAGVTASFSGLTITGGTGSGIFDQATQLTVSDCTITINSGTYGGGIENLNNGTLTVSNCTLSDNSASTSTGSGGIYNNAGTVTISGSTLSTNSASGASGEGGAIANNAGTVMVNTSTFAGNYATYGGAIFNSAATGSVLTVSNSTFSGNSAGVWGGAIYNQSKTAVSNSTFSGNSVSGSAGGGGIANFGTATLQNTLVAGNSATNGATGPDFYGSVSASVVINGATYTEGYNLIGVGAGSSGVTNGANGDQVGTAASPINPELGPLQDNGGPSQTMALADNSPAINAGVTAFATLFDQRGVARPIGTPSDVGAYQLLTLGTNALTEGAAAGTDTDVVTFTGAWTAASNASWLHISSGGTGNGLATITFDANTPTDANHGATRTGTLTIALEVVTVTQAGSTYVAANPVTPLDSTGLSFPFGVAVDGSGNVYFSDNNNNAVDEWQAATNTITTLVSSGLNAPSGVAVDSLGNVFIADTGNNAIEEWHAATNSVSTLVSGLSFPYDVAVDGSDNVYIADTFNNAIKEWNATTKNVTTLSNSTWGLNTPSGVAVDSSGNVYISNTGAETIEEWNVSTQNVSTLVPSGLYNPHGLAVDSSGNVYIADSNNNAVEEWNATTHMVSTLVYTATVEGVAVDGSGNVYIAESFVNAVTELPRAFVPSGAVSEPVAAGSDALLPVLPTSELLAAPFAPTSNQSWLTVGTVSSGVVHFSFTKNTGVARTAQLTVLGQQINVTQPSGQTTPTFSNLSPPSITYGTATQTISGQLNGNGGGSIPQGETVVVTLNGVPQNATLISSDTFSTTFNTSMLSVSSSPYTISFSYAGDANFTSASTTSNLTVYALAVTLTGSETYSGAASAPASALTVSNKVSGDTLTLSGSVALASANVGTETITSFAGVTLGGASASNYTLTGATGSVTVTTAALAVTLTGSETYNGTASAPASALTVSNKVSGDTLTLSGSVTLASANAGAETITSFAGLTLGGASASNYTLTGATGSVTVNPEALTITATNQNQVYGFGGTSAALGTTGFKASSGTIYNGDITGVTITADGADDYKSGSGNYRRGAWDLTASAATGPGVANYNITYANNLFFTTAVLRIAPQPLTISGMRANDKPYDGTTTATIDNSGDAPVGVIAGDVVNLNTSTTASFSQANAGNFLTVTGSLFSISDADADNYSLSQPTAIASIEPALLTITASNQGLTYGVALDSTAFKVSGLVSPDSISGVALATNDGTSKLNDYQVISSAATITPSAAVFSRGNSSNYSITYVRGSLVVNPAPLTVTGVSGSNKPYDGTTNDTISGTASLLGLISGDSGYVTLNVTGAKATLASANTGTEAVTVTGYTISGTDAGDYTLSQPPAGSVTVIPQTPPPGAARCTFPSTATARLT